MIGNSKPLASLSSTLLARKGTARPAMRSQGYGGFGAMRQAHDDLGWNDMGDTDPQPEPVAEAAVTDAPIPPVLLQREILREEFAVPPVAAPPVIAPSVVEASDVDTPAPTTPAPAAVTAVKSPRSVSVATATRIRRETSARHVANTRSAFTLRLDTDRHLKLRLASALQNRSAQLLVTEALDAFLETLPDVAALVSQLPGRADAKK